MGTAVSRIRTTSDSVAEQRRHEQPDERREEQRADEAAEPLTEIKRRDIALISAGLTVQDDVRCGGSPRAPFLASCSLPIGSDSARPADVKRAGSPGRRGDDLLRALRPRGRKLEVRGEAHRADGLVVGMAHHHHASFFGLECLADAVQQRDEARLHLRTARGEHAPPLDADHQALRVAVDDDKAFA